jgi:copper/silver efflux system protein
MIAIALRCIASIFPIYRSLGSEFMPPLWEETLLYMPATLPAASIQTMSQAIQAQDKI